MLERSLELLPRREPHAPARAAGRAGKRAAAVGGPLRGGSDRLPFEEGGEPGEPGGDEPGPKGLLDLALRASPPGAPTGARERESLLDNRARLLLERRDSPPPLGRFSQPGQPHVAPRLLSAGQPPHGVRSEKAPDRPLRGRSPPSHSWEGVCRLITMAFAAAEQAPGGAARRRHGGCFAGFGESPAQRP